MKIGIPKALYYYYIKDFILFLEKLGVQIVTFDTTKEIIDLGNLVAGDEMCLSLKIFLGHVSYLKDKCDYILIPNIKNYGKNDLMCTNFTSLYNLVSNLFHVNILTYEIDYKNKLTEKEASFKIGQELGFSKKHIIKCIKKSKVTYNGNLKSKIITNMNNLKSSKKKILIVSHPYNLYDEFVGKPIIKYLENLNCEIIYSDLFDAKTTSEMSKYLSSDLYFKYSKNIIGSIVISNENIDGILFLTTFPCGIDSLVNELVIRKINKPYLNLVIDDLDSQMGVITRLESFVDIIEQY